MIHSPFDFFVSLTKNMIQRSYPEIILELLPIRENANQEFKITPRRKCFVASDRSFFRMLFPKKDIERAAYNA